MLISVVITFYNQQQYVSRAVKSVLRQTYRTLDIIIVDDGSEGSIELMVKEFRDARIRFFRKENGGAASARNLGIQEAVGNYIAFLDGDDVYLPGKIEALVKVLKENEYPECIVTTGAYVFNRRGRFIDRIKPRSYAVGELIDTSLVRPSCAIYHKELFITQGGFPEHMSSNEDGALNTVIAQKYPIIAIPDPLMLYQLDDAGLARKNLVDYGSAVSVLELRLSFVSAHIDSPSLFKKYREASLVNLLLGFLSQGNLKDARKWKKENGIKAGWNGPSAVLASLSLIFHANLYMFVRQFRQFIISRSLRHAEELNKEYLF
ncbi:glycosyltransferase family A protein [Pontiellaceae bacterium B1224]|nr:glycosyltransferase family A protein [Pontiellaceae bacterium B1224]